MAVQHGYGASIHDGLIFAYDTSDIFNSYKGEPTTNQLTNSDFQNGTSGWTFGSWDSSRYSYSIENIMGPFGEIVPALKIVRTSSDTSYAHFHQGNGGKFTSGNTYTISVYVKGSGTLGQYTQGGYSPITYNPGQFVTLSNSWQRISYTLTSQTNSLYPYWAAENITQNSPLYFVFAQSELNSHPTQYTSSTRTSTNSLVDLVGGSTPNLSGMSYDSLAIPTFDGSNDTISIPSSTLNNVSGNITLEQVLKRDSPISATPIHKEVQYTMYITSGGAISYADSSYWCYSCFGYHGNVPTGTYNHIVATRSGALVTIYLNGSIVVSQNFGGAISQTGNRLYIGSYDGSSAFFNGYIPVSKIYNRALTQTEVLQNYKKYQTRFGLS